MQAMKYLKHTLYAALAAVAVTACTGDFEVSMSPVQRGDPASSCVACGECLAKCPQHLDIPNLLARVRETMGK